MLVGIVLKGNTFWVRIPLDAHSRGLGRLPDRVKPGSVPSYPNAYATTALPHAGEERADGNVEHAGPEDLHPTHVDDTELQAGHDKPGRKQREEIGNYYYNGLHHHRHH